jgi:type IV secretion system protein VirB8
MLGKKKDSPKVDATVAKAVNFEVSIAEIARRSEKRAWIVAMGSMLMALILAGGYFFMIPLKEKVPYLVIADAYTGTASMVQLKGDYNTVERIATSDALHKASIAQYVQARESYEYYNFWNRDFRLVQSMSAPQVAGEYRDIQNPKRNFEAPVTVYGQDRAIRIKILSLQVSKPPSPGAWPNSAIIRFQRSVYDKKNFSEKPLDTRYATISFYYSAELSLRDEDRHYNPLGFQVTAYNATTELGAVIAPQSSAPLQQANPQFQQQGDPTFFQQQPGGQPLGPGQQPVAPGQPQQFQGQQVQGGQPQQIQGAPQPQQFQGAPQPGGFPPQGGAPQQVQPVPVPAGQQPAPVR